MGFSSLQSLVCRRVRGVSVPAVRGGSVVSDGVARFTHQPSPTACAMGSSSRASCPLRSVFACAPAPPLSVRRVLPWGSLPSSRRYRWSPHLAGLPGTRFVPSSGFLDLSTACSTTGIAGLFHPAATSRVSVQGFGLAPQPCRLVAGHASLPFAFAALTGCPAATPRWLDFEALLRDSMRSTGSVFTLPRRRSPLRVLLLQAPATALARLPGRRS